MSPAKTVRAAGAHEVVHANAEIGTAAMTVTLRTVCAWCSRLLAAGPLDPEGRVSHGICPGCLARVTTLRPPSTQLERVREQQLVQ